MSILKMQELKVDPISTAVPRVDWRENRGFLLLIKKTFTPLIKNCLKNIFKKISKDG